MIEGQEGVFWQEWLAIAETAERSGFDALFRSDHYLSVMGGEPRESLDAWTTLAALAARTHRIRLGTLVSPVTFRHPAVIAKSVATVDHVSGGRVELGLGTGWNEREHAAFGFPFPSMPERMEHLEEQVEVVVRLWTEESASFAGRHYRLDDVAALPRPVQQPRPPLVLGGAAGPRAAALAARFADEYNTFMSSPDEVVERRRRILEACERAGRDPATMRFSLMTPCCVGEDAESVLERARRIMRKLGADGDPAAFLDEHRDRWIVGTVDEAAARLEELAALGLARVYLQHLAHDDVEAIELLASLRRRS